VLERLRSHAFLRVDDEQEEVDAGRSSNHRAHEPHVTGDVDERQAPPIAQLERCVAEVDRYPARPLLRQPVGVLARHSTYEPRLPLLAVPGVPAFRRHALTAVAAASTSSSVGVRQSRSSLPSRTMPTTGGACRRKAGASDSSTAHANDGSSASGSAPPPTRAT